MLNTHSNMSDYTKYFCDMQVRVGRCDRYVLVAVKWLLSLSRRGFQSLWPSSRRSR